MILVLHLHLLSALLPGLLVYELVRLLAPRIQKRLTGKTARLIAIVALATVTMGALILLILGTVAFFKSDTGNLQTLFDQMQRIITDASAKLPPWIVDNLPGNVDDLKSLTTVWLDEHSQELQRTGKEAMHLFVHLLFGMVIGALLSLHEGQPINRMRPLAAALTERAIHFGDAFRKIVFAQVRISALNTIFTGIFLQLILPLFGVHLPLAKTLIALAFLTGLLPVIGNLISNTVITIVGLSISIYVAASALVFLVIIHKLEYFLNAKIVGSRINARAWELLLAMIVMEAAFGIAGLIAAPIYYAYIKNELSNARLI
jgi:predicted PurR-regulated permease PerM